MTKREVLGLGLVASLGLVWFSLRSRPQPLLPAASGPALASDEAEKVIVTTTRVSSARYIAPTAGAAAHVAYTGSYVPPEGHTEVTVKKNGEVVVKAQTQGFCFRPGVGVGWTNGVLAVFADAKIMYYGRLGLLAGIPLKREVARLYLGGSFQVYNNTALFVGYQFGGSIVAGLRISF